MVALIREGSHKVGCFPEQPGPDPLTSVQLVSGPLKHGEHSLHRPLFFLEYFCRCQDATSSSCV